MKASVIITLLMLLVSCGGGGGAGGSDAGNPGAGGGGVTSNTGIIYRGEDSVGNDTFKVLFPSKPSKNFSRSNVTDGLILNWNKYLVYVRPNVMGHKEVHLLNIDTQQEKQISNFNTIFTNFEPTLIGFANGVIVVQTQAAGLSANEENFKSILATHISGLDTVADWKSLSNGTEFTGKNVSADVRVSSGGVYGLMTAAGVTKAYTYYKDIDGTWVDYTVCAGYGCTSPMRLVGMDGSDIYYVGRSNASSTIALRNAAQQVVANNMLNGVDSVTEMIKHGADHYFVAHNGTDYVIMTVDSYSKTLVQSHSATGAKNLMSDGSRLYYQANAYSATDVLHEGNLALEYTTVTKAAMINGKVVYMKNGNTEEFVVLDGSIIAVDLHEEKGLATSTFGPFIGSTMYYAKFVSPTKSVLASYNIESHSTQELDNSMEAIDYVSAFNY